MASILTEMHTVIIPQSHNFVQSNGNVQIRKYKFKW